MVGERGYNCLELAEKFYDTCQWFPGLLALLGGFMLSSDDCDTRDVENKAIQV